MKERLINNLGLKVLSIFLAFFIWLVVVNVSNPLVSSSREVPLEIENDQVLTVARRAYEIGGKSTVTVTFDIHTRDEYKIRASDFRAYVDLSELYNVTGSVPVKVEVLNHHDIYKNVSSKPGVVRVKTEELQIKPFDLKVDTEGKAEDGYALNGITLSPETVNVEGPISQVRLINHVGVKVNIDGLSGDDQGHAKPVFYDANGAELEVDERVHTDVDDSGVEYHVFINKVKELSLDFEISGEVAPGYQYTGVECSKRSVSVMGMKSSLAALNTIVIPASALNLDGARQDRQITVDIRDFLPEGVEIVESDTPVVDVLLKVEPLVSKTLGLTLDDVVLEGKSDDLEYQLVPSQVEVTVRGLQEDLDKLDKKDLKASLNLTGLSAGTHAGNLILGSSHIYTVVSQSPFQIQVDSHSPVVEGGTQPSDGGTGGENTEGSSVAVSPEEKPSGAETGHAVEAGAAPEPASGTSAGDGQ